MATTLITAPAIEPVTVQAMKIHLREDINDNDILIDGLIRGVRRQIEVFLWRQLITATWELVLDDFPTSDVDEIIIIPYPTLQTIVSVKYIDTDGVEQTVAAADYKVDTDSEPGRVEPVFETFWPEAREEINAVRVQFTAGYGALETDIPDNIISALKLGVADLYEHREAQSEVRLQDNKAFMALLWPERVMEAV